MSDHRRSASRWSRQDLHSDLVTWRARRLLGAGFSASDSFSLGHDPAVDLHALLELIDRGCPPELAVRITAPL
jgi:hypothetical protein